jgi:amino acid adenylation domain-containing protein
MELDPLPITEAEAALAVRYALRGHGRTDLATTAVGVLARRAGATPDRIAVVHREKETSYRALAGLVGRIRRVLLDRGCAAGDVVACHGPRGVTTIAVFLALEGLGAVYLPLDSSWPEVRLAEILARSGAALAIDYHADPTAAMLGAATTTGTPVVLLGAIRPAPAGEATAAVLLDAGRERLADPSEPRYLYYTSGSTGSPKGTLIEHRGMVNHCAGKIRDLGLGPTDRLGFTAPLVFDIAICQMVLPILTGGTAVVLDEAHLQFPRALLGELGRQRVTVVEVVPTVVGWLVDAVRRTGTAPPELRWVVSTGEELRPAMARRVADTLPRAALLNSYGFTETSDDVAHHRVRPEDLTGSRVPVGHPVADTTLYVLVAEDGRWRAAVPGEAGELFVGGLPVGRGYLDDPVATRAAYFRDVLDPASPTGRLYRTGDAALVCDGLLHCLGRLDRQTKIAGVRVEPDEVEAALLRHPDVQQCAVLARTGTGTTELLAYYVGRGSADPGVLHRFLRETLPAAMVPQRWIAVDALPLNGNGKVDYQALAGYPVQEKELTR